MNSLAGKTILVTGATGFIGTHLVKQLLKEKSVKLVLLSRKHNQEIPANNATWICSDLKHLSNQTWIEAGVNYFDIIFHLGAFTPKSTKQTNSIKDVYDCNLLGTRALLESQQVPPKKIIFASTLDVYDATSNQLHERSCLGPTSLYGASKLFCELLINDYAKNNGCDRAILRYGHIFGPGEGAYDKLIPQIIRRLLKNQEPVLYGDGSAERDFLYISDAVEATLRASTAKEEKLGPINIVRGASSPIRDIAELLIKITGFKGKIKFLRDMPNSYSLRFDNRKMLELLGQWDFVELENGLREEVEYFRKLPS